MTTVDGGSTAGAAKRKHSYETRRWTALPAAQDLYLVLALVALLALHPTGAIALALAAAIAVAIVHSRVTLHWPSAVEMDGDTIAFSAYGRTHRYALRDVERLEVRRFLVRDRVLVRIVPAPALAGRYWLLDSIEGYTLLVGQLEAMSVARRLVLGRCTDARGNGGATGSEPPPS